jgi:hypothetical protein
MSFDVAWVQERLAGTTVWPVLAGTLAVVATTKYLRSESRKVRPISAPCPRPAETSQLAHIPSVGSASDPVLSYLGAVHYLRNGQAVTKEGYEKVRARCLSAAVDGFLTPVCPALRGLLQGRGLRQMAR